MVTKGSTVLHNIRIIHPWATTLDVVAAVVEKKAGKWEWQCE